MDERAILQPKNVLLIDKFAFLQFFFFWRVMFNGTKGTEQWKSADHEPRPVALRRCSNFSLKVQIKKNIQLKENKNLYFFNIFYFSLSFRLIAVWMIIGRC